MSDRTEHEKLREKVARAIALNVSGSDANWEEWLIEAEAAMSTIYEDLCRVNALPGESLHAYIGRAFAASALHGGRDE